MNDKKQSVIVTTRRNTLGPPIVIKAQTEVNDEQLQQDQQLLQIVKSSSFDETQSELHVDVIQEGSEQQQVFFIGLGNQDGGEPTYLQETQLIEGPDGVRYIIAGSGQELQVIESSSLQVSCSSFLFMA